MTSISNVLGTLQRPQNVTVVSGNLCSKDGLTLSKGDSITIYGYGIKVNLSEEELQQSEKNKKEAVKEAPGGIHQSVYINSTEGVQITLPDSSCQSVLDIYKSRSKTFKNNTEVFGFSVDGNENIKIKKGDILQKVNIRESSNPTFAVNDMVVAFPRNMTLNGTQFSEMKTVSKLMGKETTWLNVMLSDRKTQEKLKSLTGRSYFQKNQKCSLAVCVSELSNLSIKTKENLDLFRNVWYISVTISQLEAVQVVSTSNPFSISSIASFAVSSSEDDYGNMLYDLYCKKKMEVPLPLDDSTDTESGPIFIAAGTVSISSSGSDHLPLPCTSSLPAFQPAISVKRQDTQKPKEIKSPPILPRRTKSEKKPYVPMYNQLDFSLLNVDSPNTDVDYTRLSKTSDSPGSQMMLPSKTKMTGNSFSDFSIVSQNPKSTFYGPKRSLSNDDRLHISSQTSREINIHELEARNKQTNHQSHLSGYEKSERVAEAKEIADMSVRELVRFLQFYKMSELAHVCESHDVDGGFLSDLSDSDLKDAPFSLTDFELKRFKRIRDGILPKI